MFQQCPGLGTISHSAHEFEVTLGRSVQRHIVVGIVARQPLDMGQSGALRLLVTWGATRTRNWPAVPTLRESGIDIVSTSPFGIAGPKGMNPKVMAVLHDAFKKGMEEPAYIETMKKLDQEAFYLNSADYRSYAIAQLAEQKRLLPELGMNQE